MKIVYSFNKKGEEAAIWQREIQQASAGENEFIPFNHGSYLDPRKYIRAQLLDNLYFAREPSLMRLYDDLNLLLGRTGADALVVDNCPPYHPEFLRTIPTYKALRTSDGPLAAYDRDFAYLHAYNHVLYHTAAYSRDMTMPEKLQYCGAKRLDWWPLALFDAAFDAAMSEATLFDIKRDVDVVFVGAFARGKMPILANVKKHFGRHCKMYGLIDIPKNIYFNAKYGFPGWMKPIPVSSFGALYRRSKIGFNIHNRGKYTVGNYRLFDLPANGVLQVSDGGEYLKQFYQPGEEIIMADDIDSMIQSIEYYLDHPKERLEVARRGYRAAIARHRFRDRMAQLAHLIAAGKRADNFVATLAPIAR